MFLISPLLSLAALPFRAAWLAYTLTIGRPHFLVAAAESAAFVGVAATARPPVAAVATLLSTHPALWWGTAGLGTAAGYAATAGVAFLALYTAGPRAGDEDVAHAVAALVWGPLWWAAVAAGVPAVLLGGRGGGAGSFFGRRLLVFLGRVVVTALYARATSAAQWAGPRRGGGGDGEWEGEVHPVLPPLLVAGGGDGGGGVGGDGGGGGHGKGASPDLARVLAGGDLYAVLGVARDAPPGVLRAARARALRGCHPDKVGPASSPGPGSAATTAAAVANHAAAAAVERVTRAAALLADEGRRAEYDARLAQWEAAVALTEGGLPVTPPVGKGGGVGVVGQHSSGVEF